MNDSVTASIMQMSTGATLKRSISDELKAERRDLVVRRRRTALKILKSLVKEKSVSGELGDISESLF